MTATRYRGFSAPRTQGVLSRRNCAQAPCTDQGLGQRFIPVGWPDQVASFYDPDWQASAVRWLLDVCPSEYRAYPVLARHPVILARFAADCVESQIAATRSSLAHARAGLNDYADTPAIDALQREQARLIRARRSIALVEEALKGKVFIPTLENYDRAN